MSRSNIVPVFNDELDIDPIGGKLVEDAVIGFAVHPQEPRAAYIGDTRSELGGQLPKIVSVKISVG